MKNWWLHAGITRFHPITMNLDFSCGRNQPKKNADSLGCQELFMDFHQHFFSPTGSVCEQTYRFTQFTGCSLATPHFACETGTKRWDDKKLPPPSASDAPWLCNLLYTSIMFDISKVNPVVKMFRHLAEGHHKGKFSTKHLVVFTDDWGFSWRIGESLILRS